MDDHYFSETTTTKACLGYVSLGCSRAARLTRANQPESAVCYVLGLLCTHLFSCYHCIIQIYIYIRTNCVKFPFVSVENTSLLERIKDTESQLGECNAMYQKLQDKHKTLTEYFEQKEHNLHRLDFILKVCVCNVCYLCIL